MPARAHDVRKQTFAQTDIIGKAWFISGCPKQYGKVTVYLCRKHKVYRIKPQHGSKKIDKLAWGKTDKERLSQWRKVMEKVEKYNTCP